MVAASPVVVMGVSGAGKSTVGAALAARLGVAFVDGDELHPARNVRKMEAGIPLDDEDRAGWLDRIGEVLAGGSVVVACSALKRSYRDRLRASAPGTRFVYLRGDRELLAARMTDRRGHFMPATLLDSQLAALEEPGADERPIRVEAADDVPAIVEAAARELSGGAASPE